MVAILRGPSTGTGEQFYVFSNDDAEAQIGSAGHRFYPDEAITLQGVVVSAGAAPTGAALVVDVLLDGVTSVWDDPADRPAITPGTNEVTVGAPDHPAVAVGHYLTVSIVAVGDLDPGAKIDVRILFR